MAARLKTGDTVIVISGKDKGKTGKIARINRDEANGPITTVVVEGINLVKRHMRPTPKSPQGGILEREQALHACKVMPVDPKTGKGTRVRAGKDDKGNKVRLAKSGEQIVAAKKAEG